MLLAYAYAMRTLPRHNRWLTLRAYVIGTVEPIARSSLVSSRAPAAAKDG
jgi:hypothetical protein